MLSKLDENASIGKKGPQDSLCTAPVALRGGFVLCVFGVVAFGERDFVVYRTQYCGL